MAGVVVFSCTQLPGLTTVARMPDIDYATDMSRLVGSGEDVLVIPQGGGGTVFQLAYAEGEWEVVAEHELTGWLGYMQLHYPWVFPVGDEILVIDASPVYEGFHTPEATVLRKVDGIFEPAQTVSLAPSLQIPDLWSTMVNDIVPLTDLLVFHMQVDIVNVGAKLMGFTFLRTEAGWVTGPGREFARGYWWPLYSEHQMDGLHLWYMEMTSAYGMPTAEFNIVESLLTVDAWTDIGQSSFQIDKFWGGSHEHLRTLLSPNGTSMVVFPKPDSISEGAPLIFSKDGENWMFDGSLQDVGIDTSGLSLVQLGGTCALMRRGDIASLYGEQVKQHYHLLKHVDDRWQLVGDLTSHRVLNDYYYDLISYVLGEDWLTIFDAMSYYQALQRGARSYSLADLSPRLVKWFKESETIDPQIEHIPAFGYFAEEVSDTAQGIWAWHWNLGWIYITGRNTGHFWFYDSTFGWTWFADELYDKTAGRHWLYSWSHSDYVLCLPDSHRPRFFFSNNIKRWMTDTPAPQDIRHQDVEEVLALASSEMAETGIALTVDYEARLAVFSMSETVDGKTVALRIHAPWQYTTGTGYGCQSRFDMDFSGLSITVGNETVYVSSYDLYTSEKILMPAVLEILYIFYTPETGTMLTRIQNNDLSWEPPVFETFGL